MLKPHHNLNAWFWEAYRAAGRMDADEALAALAAGEQRRRFPWQQYGNVGSSVVNAPAVTSIIPTGGSGGGTSATGVIAGQAGGDSIAS